jgi:type IV pilus assembly protein PilB
VPFKRNKQEVTRTEDDATPAPPVARGAATGAAHAAVAVDEREPMNGLVASAPGQPIVASEEKLAGISRGRLGNLLIERKLVTDAQLEQGLAQQRESGGKIGEVLVEMGILDDRDLVATLSEFLGVPVSNLRRENVEADALALIPEDVAREQHAVPIRVSDDGLDVAAAEPSEELRDLLSKAAGRPVRMMIAPISDIRWAIDSNYRAIGGVDNLIAAFVSVEGTRKRVAGDAPDADLMSDDAPVVQVVDRILTQAIRDRASDVHIEPGDQGVRIRFRVDGALKEVLTLPDVMGPGLVSRIKIMAGMNIVERRRPQDGQLTTTIDGADVDVRVATVATIAGESCVLRVLDKSRSLYRLGDLGMPADTHAMYSKIVRAPFGMMLCAGPTGSGKTTTLYATLSEVNNPTLNVMTIEDPVEYVFPSINQIQTNEQAGITFATGLKSILRQDPDVILVGEIRDVETARVATQSALTGHFVISSMHATDSVSGLHRFLDMGIESFLIASSVLAVVAQRLVRRICPSCKTTYTLTNEERMFYEESGGPPEKEVFYHGTGCNFCGGTGFKERIGVYELLHMTPEIKRLIVGWATQEELRNLAKKQGMRTLRQEAINLVAQDITSVDEVVRSMYTL